MATAKQCKAFIEKIAPYVQKYCKHYGYGVPSAIIAQACKESAYGTSWISVEPYFNFFGLKCGSGWKGRSVSATTREAYGADASLTTIRANFRAYNSFEEGVQGYFIFINWSRYAKLRSIKTPYEYLKEVKDSGYCTSGGSDKNSSTYYQYADSAYKLIQQYNLTQYDDSAENPYPIPTRTLYRRKPIVLSGDDVKWLQHELNESGASLDVDGKFGNLTLNALLEYQRTHKDVNGNQLTADGRCGGLTRGSLLVN